MRITDMREDISNALVRAYGDLSHPSYAFAARRLDEEMHVGVVRNLSQKFVVEDQTSLGGDDVCVSLYVRESESHSDWRWCVQLSLVGNYAVVSRMGDGLAPWPVTEANADVAEAALLGALCESGMELLPYAELQEPTILRPPNSDAEEVYTVYNALFTDMVPLRRETRK